MKSKTVFEWTYKTKLNQNGCPHIGGLESILIRDRRHKNFVASQRVFLSLLKDFEDERLPVDYEVPAVERGYRATNPKLFDLDVLYGRRNAPFITPDIPLLLSKDKKFVKKNVKGHVSESSTPFFVSSSGGPNGSPG